MTQVLKLTTPNITVSTLVLHMGGPRLRFSSTDSLQFEGGCCFPQNLQGSASGQSHTLRCPAFITHLLCNLNLLFCFPFISPLSGLQN